MPKPSKPATNTTSTAASVQGTQKTTKDTTSSIQPSRPHSKTHSSHSSHHRPVNSRHLPPSSSHNDDFGEIKPATVMSELPTLLSPSSTSTLALTSPIYGHTYFFAAKKEISSKLGGKFDYVQRHKDLSSIIETKDHLSQHWGYQESGHHVEIENSGVSSGTKKTHDKERGRFGDTPNFKQSIAATAINHLFPSDAYSRREQNSNVVNSNKTKSANYPPPTSSIGTPLTVNGYDMKYDGDDAWDVDNLPLSFKVAFWRTHHPGRPTPQPAKPNNTYNETTHPHPHPHPLPPQPPPASRLLHHPPPSKTLHPPAIQNFPSVSPFPMPIMKVIRSPPLFSQNITIQRSNIKPAELTKMALYVNAPNLLESYPVPVLKQQQQQHIATQTISNAHTQTSPITRIPKTDSFDNTSQTTNSAGTQTMAAAAAAATTTTTTTTTTPDHAYRSNDTHAQTQTSTNMLESKTVSIQTNPITDTAHTQTMPIMWGANTDTSDLPSTFTFISQIDTVPRNSPHVERIQNSKHATVPNATTVDVPPDFTAVTEHLQHAHEHHITLSKANHLEKRVLQMLCDKVLTQMVQDHQAPMEVPAPATPSPPPPDPSPQPPPPPTQNGDFMLKHIIGRMIAEDLLSSLNQKPPTLSHESTQTKPPEDRPSRRSSASPSPSSFFALSDTGILSHYVEPPVAPPPPPPPPVRPPSPPPPIKTIENKASQTVQKNDVGSQAATDVATIAIQANEAIGVGIQTIESVSTEVQYENPNPVKMVETAIQFTPPPSPKKEVSMSYRSDYSYSSMGDDASDGEMTRDIISDGELVRGGVGGSGVSRANKRNLNPISTSTTPTHKYASEGELRDGDDESEGEVSGDLYPQFSEGEITLLHPHHHHESDESDGELAIMAAHQSFTNAYYCVSEGEM